MGITVRPATVADAETASSVVVASFALLGAAAWSADATNTFLQEASPQSLRTKIGCAAFARVACEADQVVAFLLMPRPSLLGMLFVAPSHLRRGIARLLWESARAHIEANHPETKTVELNSTPYALPFYRSVGFAPISKEFVSHGARATRMALWLPARGLGAENAP